MPRIDKNGNIIHHDDRRRSSIVLTKDTKIGIGMIVCFLLYFYNNYWNDPFRNGKIPASQRQSTEHEQLFISDDLSFVRKMSDPLTVTYFQRFLQSTFKNDIVSNKMTEEGRKIIEEIELKRAFEERIDYGGIDGHIAEKINWNDNESIRTTRCATTRSAISAYFCGRAVATNNDVALGNTNWKGYNYGTASLKEYIQCRYYGYKNKNNYNNNSNSNIIKNSDDNNRSKDNNNNKHHRRSVYRIGIGCTKECRGFAHAFSIVAQPDGNFIWLQSFVTFYSLSTWMKEKDARKESGLSYRLTFQELMDKLDTIDRLMKISRSVWSSESNGYYKDLFNVDQSDNLLRSTRAKRWNPNHPLDVFTWDEACEYPLPSNNTSTKNNDVDVGVDVDDDNNLFSPWKDPCLRYDMAGQIAVIRKKMDDLTNFRDDDNDDEVKEL